MKILLDNSKKFIKYALTIMVTAILLGVIFVVGFGFNASSEFGKVYEITVDCFDETKIEDYSKTVKDVLDEYNYSAAEAFVEDRSYCDTIVVRYKSTSKNNATLIEQELESKLELNENLVRVESLTRSSEVAPAVKLLITLGVVTVVLFVYGLIRYKWKVALTLAVNFILSCILPLAFLAFTRIELSLTTLGIISIISVLSTILFMALTSKMLATINQQEKPESFKTNYLAYIAENKFKVIIPAALMLLVFICLIFTFNVSLVHVGLAGVLALVLDAFILVCFSPALLITLTEWKEAKSTKKDKE